MKNFIAGDDGDQNYGDHPNSDHIGGDDRNDDDNNPDCNCCRWRTSWTAPASRRSGPRADCAMLRSSTFLRIILLLLGNCKSFQIKKIRWAAARRITTSLWTSTAGSGLPLLWRYCQGHHWYLHHCQQHHRSSPPLLSLPTSPSWPSWSSWSSWSS